MQRLTKLEMLKLIDGTWRITRYDADGLISDIWEGPFRSLINWIIWDELGRKFAVRKVRK